MKLSQILMTGLVTFSLQSAFAFDETQDMVSASDQINNLTSVLAAAKKDAKVTVEFPAIIPETKNNVKYFASLDQASKQYGFSYMINVDSTADCHGVKYCNVGMVTARVNAKVDMQTDRKNKVITVPVDLADGLKAYYTPGHPMGDYFPASIQWMDNDVLYMISWNVQSTSEELTRFLLTTMANSAKHPGSG